jgi:hypothetical protein
VPEGVDAAKFGFYSVHFSWIAKSEVRHGNGNDVSVGANDLLRTRRCLSRRNSGEPDGLVALLIERCVLLPIWRTRFANTLGVALSVCFAHLS